MERRPLPEEVVKALDIKKGMNVLDFGCAGGKYSIPIARVVGNEGKVYALDKEKTELENFEIEVDKWQLKNIELVHSNEGFNFPNESIDIVLLLDVLHHITDKKGLLKRFFEILKPNGILSVFPHIHFSGDELINIVTASGFFVLKERYGGIDIYNFQKREIDDLGVIFKK